MKKRVIKKYANELLKSMCYYTDEKDMGYFHSKSSSFRILTGKRARLITSDVVIDYINNNIRPITRSIYDERYNFNNEKLYMATFCTNEDCRYQEFNSFRIHYTDSWDNTHASESWFVGYRYTKTRPMVTKDVFDESVTRFMLSKGYERVTMDYFHDEFVNSTGERINDLDANQWYMEETKNDNMGY